VVKERGDEKIFVTKAMGILESDSFFAQACTLSVTSENTSRVDLQTATVELFGQVGDKNSSVTELFGDSRQGRRKKKTLVPCFLR
jgi:hypothetical protein